VPKENNRDLDEIDEEIKSGIEIIPVKKLKDVIKVAFVE
jgi:ATP-dependent Lon protease